MTPTLLVRASMWGIRPEMMPVLPVVAQTFADWGYGCVVTSAVRPDDTDSFHGYGLAMDFDAQVSVPPVAGHAIADHAGRQLGPDYTCLWHAVRGGNWHLHVEFDMGRRGLRDFLVREARGRPGAPGEIPPPPSGAGPSPQGG